eukprot:Tbor_TRINITY_DN3160_c0_g1::TRINITY_DN3160_c0_g1_i1::g.14623::m.14623/K00486/KMO; kynurenine 3-monooxygenase
MHVIINGGGLVGALSSMIMLKYFDKVTVIEKRDDIRFVEAEKGRSINLILTSRGLFALRSIGMEKQAIDMSVAVEARIMHHQDGSQSVMPYGVSKQEVNYSISRTGLNQLLIEEAEKRGVEFIFQKEITDIKFLPDGKVEMNYKTPRSGNEDIWTITGDVLMGNDGIGSVVRKAIHDKLKDCPSTVNTKAIEEKIVPLGISYKEISFPSDPKTGGYSLNSRGLHIWPRGTHFLMTLPDLTNTFTATLYLPDGSDPLADIPKCPVPTFEELNNEKDKVEEYFSKTYPDVPALVPDYLEQLCSRKHSPLGTVRCSNWHYKGDAIIFGDAAHGIVPFFGQGMNLGFESTMVLNRFFSLVTSDGKVQSKAQLCEIFAAYEEYHHPSSDAIADMAIENFTEMSYKVGSHEFLKKKAMENAAEAIAPKIFRSRYYMITRTLVPYRLVKEAGVIIDEVVMELLSEYAANGVTEPTKFATAITKERVEEISKKKLLPFFQTHGIEVGAPLKEYYPNGATS